MGKKISQDMVGIIEAYNKYDRANFVKYAMIIY